MAKQQITFTLSESQVRAAMTEYASRMVDRSQYDNRRGERHIQHRGHQGHEASRPQGEGAEGRGGQGGGSMNAPATLADVGTIDRRTYIGGGDISAIVGVNPFRTPLDVYLQKVGEAPPDKPDPKREARLRRGKLWEPIVVDMLREEHGIYVVARNARYVDPEFPFLASEIDFEWTLRDSPVTNGEIKSVNPFAAQGWGEPETDEVPMYNAAQSQWGMMTTGRDLCQYGVVFGADDLTLYHVRRDDDVIAWLRDAAIQFWTEHVRPRIPPPPRTPEDLLKLWPRDTGRTIEATPKVAALYASLCELRERRKVADEGIKALQFELGEFMQDRTTAVYGGAPLFTYKAQSTSHIAADELRRAHPEIAKAFTRVSEFRVLRAPSKRS